QYEAADKAWKTTRIAGEVLQDLTLQKSLSEDTAGSPARGGLSPPRAGRTQQRGATGAARGAILRAAIGKKAAELPGRDVASDHQEEPIIVDDEHQTWDFSGEYWKDELGFYRFRIASQCPRKR